MNSSEHPECTSVIRHRGLAQAAEKVRDSSRGRACLRRVLGSGGASSPNLPRAPGSSATCTRCVSGLDIPLSVPGIGSLPPRAVDRSSVTSRFSRDGRARYARSRDPPGATPAWLRVPAAPRAGSPGAEVASGVGPLGITRRSGTGSDVTRPTDCRGSRTEVGEAATVI